MEVAGHNIEFDIFKMTKHQPSYVDECNKVEVLDSCVEEVFEAGLSDRQAC